MSQSRSFHLGDVLSVTTGRLVSPGRIAAVHELLDFMTGDVLMTHQLPRASDECQPALLRQHPQLADVDVPTEFSSEAHVFNWLATQVDAFDEYLTVEPLAPQDHTRINPLTELAMNHPHLAVIPVVIDEGDTDA